MDHYGVVMGMGYSKEILSEKHIFSYSNITTIWPVKPSRNTSAPDQGTINSTILGNGTLALIYDDHKRSLFAKRRRRGEDF